MRVRVGGAWKEVSSGVVYVDGAWRQLKMGRAYVGGAWEDIFAFAPDLSATFTPSVVGGTVINEGFATSNQVTVTPAGGQPPYTYSWTQTTGNDATVVSPASAMTTFTRFLTSGQVENETFRCTVTDNFGTTATVDVNVTFSSIELEFV